MAEAKTAVAHKPVWTDLTTSDPEGARKFYSAIFGWKVEVNPDPQYGGYALAKAGGKDVAGIGPKQMDQAPTAWTVYIGTPDAAETAKKAEAAGGKIIAPVMAVGDQGHMAIIQDPSGAYLGLWQAGKMQGVQSTGSNAMGWAELNARGFHTAEPFYKQLFGWGEKKTPAVGENPEYTEFQLHGDSIAGGMEMNPMVPEQVPSHWMVYFNVDNVDKAFDKVIEHGGKEMLSPMDMPGGRFAIVSDPQGAAFGILKMEESR
ncbi:MAG TPA: VOC family protein [Candidatus Acidoferrum sp.]|jgi:predicted enzyme related to lactoylglutathione lyase|nr:VOC family protein [Candidatus Acidoferrum sp.]